MPFAASGRPIASAFLAAAVNWASGMFSVFDNRSRIWAARCPSGMVTLLTIRADGVSSRFTADAADMWW